MPTRKKAAPKAAGAETSASTKRKTRIPKGDLVLSIATGIAGVLLGPKPRALQLLAEAISGVAAETPHASSSGGSGGAGGGGRGSGGDDGGSGGDERERRAKGKVYRRFDPDSLEATVIAIPLAEAIAAVQRGEPVQENICFDEENGLFPVIIDVTHGYPGGRERAKHRIWDLLARVLHDRPSQGRSSRPDDSREQLSAHLRRWSDAVPARFRQASPQYVFADLTPREIQELVRLDNGWPSTDTVSGSRVRSRRASTIFRIWPSHPVAPQLVKSVSTVKGDAATATFGAWGTEVAWAVVDSGISGDHRHFANRRNLEDLPDGVRHRDFTGGLSEAPLRDVYGHGTHVAGIIAGESADGGSVFTRRRDEQNRSINVEERVAQIRGVAPQCKLVSYKVLDDRGRGDVRNIIAALEDIARINDHGRQLRIHGVNLSLGYPFEAEWYACGQSTLCDVVNRLVRSGVVVVAAAGNTGYAQFEPEMVAGTWAQGVALSINDPGNADLAITVGSTHRDAPHKYGASYFSSKGPTGDGRLKPDLLAPGERIISCNAQERTRKPGEPLTDYCEKSGTSMAAPHVSGAVAAFLSVRSEFKGRSEIVKQIFMNTATDLKRERYMQGAGLVDLLRAIQSV